MSDKLGQESAFPERVYELDGQGNYIYYDKMGINKRFYAACAAMQGLISANPTDIQGNSNYGVPSVVVDAAYAFADELLKQENK